MVNLSARISRQIKRASLFSILSVIALTLAGCNFLTAPMTTIGTVTDWGRDINRVYLITTIVCSLVGIVVAGLMVYVIIRFRERPGDTHIPKQVHGNFKLELLWSIIPCILLMFIVIPTWEVLFKYERGGKPAGAMNITVVGHQWWWEFQYPDLGIVTANELHLPENTPVYFTITSVDVIHSFWVPKFGGKVDALPGEHAKNYMVLTTPPATADGGDYYQGQCVELCGDSHALMRFQAVVHKKDEWDRFVKTYNEPPVIETKKEKRGEELLTTKGCIACHTISGTIAAGILGPNLTNFGNRKMLAAGVFMNDQEHLAKWLANPPAIKPGSLMQNLELNQQEISDLSAFLRNSTYKRY